MMQELRCAMRSAVLVAALSFFVAASVEAITIGQGPAIGTDKRGTTWFQEFQDWTKDDVRALDPNNDQHRFNDAHDPGRDLIAFYSRDGGAVAAGGDGNYYFRVDFFDLLFGAQAGNVDVYVAIDCAAGGRTFMPDNIETNTDTPWEVVVKLYQHDFAVLEDKNGNNVTAGNWLGSYWRSDLDGVEFGITRQVLINAGWDGHSVIRFQVYTTRDGTNNGPGEIPNGSDVVDFIGTLIRNENNSGFGRLLGAIPSNSSTGRAKYAAIAHANQSVATRTGTQGHIYTNRSDINLHPGFIRTVETHAMLKAPLNMHLSGSLISSLLWALQDPAQPGFPERDGPTFVNSLKALIASGHGSLIGGVYAEHIMPYFEGAVNQSSIKAFNDLAETVFGLTAADMKVMHIPERVMHANTSWPHANPAGPLKGQPMNDIIPGGYVATYLDEVTHLHWWFYPNEHLNPWWTFDPCGAFKWAGFAGTNDEPYHHKLHKINGVLTFMINDREDNAKFGNDDGGMSRDTRHTLLMKALSPDYAQITIVFDDWEAFAGNSFASATPNENADQWHTTIRWAANHPWIEIVHLKDVVTWAQSDAAWVIDQGVADGKTSQTYEWLKRASEHSYDHWYYGSAQEQDFFSRIPPTAPSGFSLAGTKKYGDMNTPGTLLRDSWDKVAAMPAGRLRTLAEWTYSAMIYETAWHDEDANPDQYQSRNYQITFNRNDACTTSYEDTTWDPISGWALRLHGHVRKVGIHADAAQWVEAIRTGTQGAATLAEQKDVDDDLWPEYILRNDRVYLCFKRWGARLIYAFVYNPETQEAEQVIGVPVANPAEEHDGEGADNNRVSALKDRYVTSGPDNYRFIDMDFAVTAPVQGPNYWEFVSANGQVRKRVTLPGGRDAVHAEYTLASGLGTMYVRNGLGPNQLDLLHHGDAHLSVQTDPFFYGLVNSAGGAAFVVRGVNSARSVGQLPNAGYQNRELPLVEQVEVFNTSSATNFSFSLAFSTGTANDIDGDGLTNAQEQALGSDFTRADTDGNGMSDGFEYQYFGTPTGNDPHGDADGDGLTNLQEFLAGTSPIDPHSVFRVTNVARTKSGFSVSWNAVPGKSYRVLAADDLLQPFQPISGAITSTPFHDNTTAARRFYRVEVLLPPP
jgi:hypothetical protein